MDNDFEYRRYLPGDEAGIHALLQKSFTKWSRRSLDYLKWKYLESPRGIHVYVAVDGDKIVGAVCDIPLQIKLFDQTVNATYSDDTATDPDYRGRGIYSKLYSFYKTDQVNRGNQLAIWETENPIITKVTTGLHKPFPFPICRMIKIKDVDKYLKMRGRDTLKNWIGFTLLKTKNSLTTQTPNKNKTRQDFTLSQVQRFDDTVDVFWERIKNDYNYILEKKQDYLNWRYCKFNPEQHQVRAAKSGEQMLGYIALSTIKDEDNTDGAIRDLLTLKDRPDVAEALLDDTLTQFESMGVNSIYSQTIRGHPHQRLLAKKGFIDVSRASKNVVYYTPQPELGLDEKKFSESRHSRIYFNLY